MKKWTKKETEQLKKLFFEGLPKNEIATQMNRSYRSIDDKIWESGWKREPLASSSAKMKKAKVPDVIEKLVDKVKDLSLEKLPAIPMPKVQYGKGDEEEAILQISDWQLGHKTVSFNSEIAKQRVQKLIEAIFKIVALHRNSYPVKKINLFLQGDFIQSESVGFLVDLSELEMILIDQVFKGAVPLLSWLVEECAKNFEQVNLFCNRGNHGRGQKGSSEKTNFDDVIYFVLQERFSQNPRVKFQIAREFYQVATIQGHNFLLAHGDQVRGGSYGIPLYALLQRMLRWAGSMPEKWKYLCVGHWHCYAHLEQNAQELFVNGTLVSDDEYVRKMYGWNSSTSQNLMGIHPRGITWRYKLDLL